jgi:hypothetical protein
MAKRGLFVRVEETLLKEFKAYVLEKYGKIDGVLGIEIQNAMNHWLNEARAGAHTQTHINPGIPLSQARVDQIINRLKSRGYINQFTLKDWEIACIDTVGSDPRTIRKYLKLAGRLGRIKPITPIVWEII